MGYNSSSNQLLRTGYGIILFRSLNQNEKVGHGATSVTYIVHQQDCFAISENGVDEALHSGFACVVLAFLRSAFPMIDIMQWNCRGLIGKWSEAVGHNLFVTLITY